MFLVGVYFVLNGVMYTNNSAVPLSDVGEGEMLFFVKPTRRIAVEPHQTGLASSTTQVISRCRLLRSSKVSIATEVKILYA